MPCAAYIPITGSVLRWAIDESGLSNSEFAEKVRTEPDNVQAWISGQAQPTKTQFNKIVSTLKRPIAAFFLPEPPQHLNLPPPLRRSVGATSRALNARELRAIRWITVTRFLDPDHLDIPRAWLTHNGPPAARS